MENYTFNDYNKNYLVNGNNCISKKGKTYSKKTANKNKIKTECNTNYKKYPSQKYRNKRYKLKSKCKFKKRRYNNSCNSYVCNKYSSPNQKFNNNEYYACKKRRKGCGCFSPLWWLLFFLII